MATVLHRISPQSPARMVASATKVGLLQDLEYLRDRLTDALKGNIKFLDADQTRVGEALRKLSAVSSLLEAGLIPTNKE